MDRTDKILELIKELGGLAQILIALLVGWHKWLKSRDKESENKKLKEKIIKLETIIENFERK